ncbi:glucokinase [Desulfococcus sp.]|uniref:glucokinase n=1 Tax=Desulfococcus sp. TaxID=2025834 RepID=UPI0035934F9F
MLIQFDLIDIGGTNTRVARCESQGTGGRLVEMKTYNSKAYSGLEEIINDYGSTTGRRGEYAVIGVAGPVVDGAAMATNLPWVVDEARLKKTLGFSRVSLINDVEALGHSIEVLQKDDLDVIHAGSRREGFPAALIAPGTGLGEAFLIPHENAYRVFSSEGGHSDFAPATDLELKLLAHLRSSRDHVSYEQVCSGPGIHTIYRFLKAEGICREPPWLKSRLASAGDPVEIIAENALSGKEAEDITVKAIDVFVSILGAEAGNMALRYNARAGVYIGGGVASKILPFVKKDGFLTSFKTKGRLSGVVSDIPVLLIRKFEANLYGLANYARKTLCAGR